MRRILFVGEEQLLGQEARACPLDSPVDWSAEFAQSGREVLARARQDDLEVCKDLVLQA